MWTYLPLALDSIGLHWDSLPYDLTAPELPADPDIGGEQSHHRQEVVQDHKDDVVAVHEEKEGEGRVMINFFSKD